MNTTPYMSYDEILQEFNDLETWEERCDFLIDLGFDLPDFPDAEKTEDKLVRGCQSNVWMVLKHSDENSEIVEIAADSDAMIVRGLIAVLLSIYSGKTADEILAIDPRQFFSELGLDRHLSPARRNGLGGMVQRIREFAEQAA